MTNNPATGRFHAITAWPLLAQILAAMFAVTSVANVLGITWTKPLLMPLLLAWALTIMIFFHMSGSWQMWLVVGLIFSWLGDLALMGTSEVWFMTGLGAFAIAQIAYIFMFGRIRGVSLVRAWKIAVIPYLIFWIVINVWITPGDLRIPVVIYSALLVAMAVCALNISLRLYSPWRFVPAIGAVSFMISDSLIALQEFNGLGISQSVIMGTYVVGQAMIVGGVVLGQKPTITRQHSPTLGGVDQ